MDLLTRMRLEACASGETEIAQVDNLGRVDAKNLIDARWWNADLEVHSPLDDEPDGEIVWGDTGRRGPTQTDRTRNH